MIKNHKRLPINRPYSRLDNNALMPKALKTKRTSEKSRSPQKMNQGVKRKYETKSPTKQNIRPHGLKRQNQHAKLGQNIKLPLINLVGVETFPEKEKSKQITDFQSYCAAGHPVFVDQRDAGVALGHLNKNEDQSQKKMHEKHIGQIAYVPYNLDILKSKIGQKVNTSINASDEQENQN